MMVVTVAMVVAGLVDNTGGYDTSHFSNSVSEVVAVPVV